MLVTKVSRRFDNYLAQRGEAPSYSSQRWWMDRSEFEQQGRSLAWSPEVSSKMAGALTILQMSLAEAGVRPHAERVGSMVHTLAGHGHYRGCLVDDPELGVYAVHLELVVDWDSVTLDLIAYKGEFNAREAS